jgi:hypothetical protein
MQDELPAAYWALASGGPDIKLALISKVFAVAAHREQGSDFDLIAGGTSYAKLHSLRICAEPPGVDA